MVFSWGSNHNHQLGLFQLSKDQVDYVHEPTLVEDLLQFNYIRKIKCQNDKTLILVDQPNTLIIYSKRDNLRDANVKSPRGRSRQSGSESQEGEGNVDDSPE